MLKISKDLLTNKVYVDFILLMYDKYYFFKWINYDIWNFSQDNFKNTSSQNCSFALFSLYIFLTHCQCMCSFSIHLITWSFSHFIVNPYKGVLGVIGCLWPEDQTFLLYKSIVWPTFSFTRVQLFLMVLLSTEHFTGNFCVIISPVSLS